MPKPPQAGWDLQGWLKVLETLNPPQLATGGTEGGTFKSSSVSTNVKLTEALQWYGAAFRDPMMLQPPEWFRAFMYSEAFLQLPFFPVAAYAFLKGGCRWIRTPAIIYSTHVATTLFAILAHILFHDFSKSEHPGPETQRERLVLLSIYSPYLLIPLLLLFTMLYNPHYNQVEKRKRK